MNISLSTLLVPRTFTQEKSQISEFEPQLGKISIQQAPSTSFDLKDVNTIVFRGAGGEWLSPWRKIHPKGKERERSVGWKFQNKFPNCLQSLWLKESHIRKGQKILQSMLILISQGFPAKPDNLNAYSKFLLQSRILCALKRRKDNLINCSLQIKALFCRFPPDLGQLC